MLSIVIPTINEEEYLPLLIKSIKEQDCSEEVEIIVADSGSNDKTKEIADSFFCRVFDINNVSLPAQAKNGGAAFARGELILFVDADVILPKLFLQKAVNEFKKRNLGTASFYIDSKNKWHKFLYFILYNLPAKITWRLLPQAMNVILIKRDIHLKLGGFDEQIRLGEELDYIRRARRAGKFGILNSVSIFCSSRRFENDGWFITWFKYFLCQIHIILWGPVKSDIFKYKFNHYPSSATAERRSKRRETSKKANFFE